MARGGRRTGTPGTAYPNRSDLQGAQPVTAATGQAYGQAGAQRAAQQAIPLPGPGELGPFDRPTERPQEPVTAGLPVGAGPGPEALDVGAPEDDFASELHAIFQKYPNTYIGRLIESIDADQ